ncbi:MAG: hypothetical protein EXS31_12615 [Pedosphaera sp.]|nr:hypothetical protein [Pedosphaera sp.]
MKLVAVPMTVLSLAMVALAAEKGAEKLVGTRPVEPGTKSPAAMVACGKCTKAPYTSVDFSARGAIKESKTVVGSMAPDCEDRLVAMGHGKGKVETIEHRCGGKVVARSLCCK